MSILTADKDKRTQSDSSVGITLSFPFSYSNKSEGLENSEYCSHTHGLVYMFKSNLKCNDQLKMVLPTPAILRARVRSVEYNFRIREVVQF